jgi:Cu-Zn family superoxide dismutase
VGWSRTSRRRAPETIVNPHVTLGDGEATLFDKDGSAIVVHSGLDDYESQPSGNAGQEIACAVIRR